MSILIEAFSRGKHFERPEDNEDAFVVLPGLGYTVIDGVTDRGSRRYGGVRPGRRASQLAARAVARFLAWEDLAKSEGAARAERLVAAVSAALRAGYEADGRLGEAAADPRARMGCTVAAAVHDGDAILLVSVGDSAIRVSGPTIGVLSHVETKPLDMVTAFLRRETWLHLEARGAPPELCRAAADRAAWHGLATPPDGLSAKEAARLAAAVAGLCADELAGVSAEEVARLVGTGISGQRAFANHPDADLAYGVVDGFDLPERHVFTLAYPARAVHRIELFTDGYFDPPAGFGVECWEASFRAVEHEDPDKVRRFPSTKGSVESAWTDDRTYVGVDFGAG